MQIIYKKINELDGMYVDENIKGMSFRNYKNLLLVGGGDHRTGKTGGNWDQLRNFAKKYNPYQAVFNPSRSMLKPQLLVNGFEPTKNLLTISTKRCPHMGCALKWNEVEYSWDCPCHGSRFGEDGTLLNNPANGDKMIDD